MSQVSADSIDCPDLPFPLIATDRKILATADEDYHRITWNELELIIANNTLQELTRLPSDLRRYLAWSQSIKKEYGSVTAFVIQNRLHWESLTATHTTFEYVSETPFAARGDYAVLLNDWPYGFELGIAHFVVWCKTRTGTDSTRGDVTLESKGLIEDFVERYFVKDLGGEGREQVRWFKNWVNASVRGIDHIHVLVKNAPQALLNKWATDNDS